MSAARGIRRAYDHRLEELGLNLSEASLLAFVAESGPSMQADLARHLGVGKAAMGSLVDALESRNLVERCPKPDDRRVWLVSITRAGQHMADRIAKIDGRLRAELRQGISRKERRELNQLLTRLAGNIRKVIDQED